MKVSQLANALKVAPDTVRFYTRIGFIKPQINQNNGYKQYSKKDQERLRFILSARHLGFTVKDIRKILEESDKGKTSCPLVRKIIETRLEETEQQFRETQALRDRMQQAVVDWKSKPNQAPSSEMICHLIEEFNYFRREDISNG